MAVVDIGGRVRGADGERSRWRSLVVGALKRPAPEWLALRLEAERERLIVWVPVAFGVGIVCYFRASVEPSLVSAAAVAGAGVLVRLLLRRFYVLGFLAGLVAAAALGFGLAKARTELQRAPVLEKRLTAAEVTGVVVLAEPRPGRGQRLTLDVLSIRGLAPAETPRRIRLRAMTISTPLSPGDVIRIRANLAPPAPPALPGGYDFARTAWFLRLGATGYSITAPIIEPPVAEPGLWASFSRLIEDVRQRVGDRIAAVLPGDVGAIAVSLITGERGGLSEETTDAFRDSGLVHILSISGLHMVVMAGAVFVSIRLLLALYPPLALHPRAKAWAAAAALVAAFGYLLLSGSSIATVRAFLMIAVMFIAIMLDRPAIAMRNVALSALLILVTMPESVLDAGFQMSYAAVVSLIAAYDAIRASEGLRDEPGLLSRMVLFLGGIVLSTVIAGFAVAPFGVYHFHRSQQYALLANLVAIPVCNLLIMPAALITLVLMPFGLEAVPLSIMGWGVGLLDETARFVAGLPGAVLMVPQISDVSFGVMLVGGLWFIIWRTGWRLFGLPVIAVGALIATDIARPDLIAGADGALVVVRSAAGRLEAPSGGRQHEFELSRFLEHDGDQRKPNEARQANVFRCDGVGCIADVRGQRVAVSWGASALRDDCAAAAIVISERPVPAVCAAPKLVIGRDTFRERGAHAVTIEAASGDLRVVTVGSLRGVRPWSEPPRRRERWVDRGARLGSRDHEASPRRAETRVDRGSPAEDGAPDIAPQ